MKIAMIGSVVSQAPSVKGIIQAPLKLTFDLARELSRRGHGVTFFGLVNPEFQALANFKCDNLGYLPRFKNTDPLRPDFFITYEQGMISKVLERADEFDVIYSHVAYRIGPFARLVSRPIVATHHDATHMEEYNPILSSFQAKNLFIIPISNYLKSILHYDNYLDVVYHGLDEEEIPFGGQPDNYFCWIGRITPSKGLDVVIKLSKEMGLSLKVAGPFGTFPDFGEQAKYLADIKKEFASNPHIEYLGVLGQGEIYNLFSKAKGFIFPSSGQESCPLVTIESMLAGTPVITTAAGPLPELVEPGATGYLCETEQQLKEAIERIESVDRAKCRASALKKFSLKTMADGYERQFARALQLYERGETSHAKD